MDIAPHEVSQSMRLEHPETHGSCLLAALVISRQKDKQAEIQKDQGQFRTQELLRRLGSEIEKVVLNVKRKENVCWFCGSPTCPPDSQPSSHPHCLEECLQPSSPPAQSCHVDFKNWQNESQIRTCWQGGAYRSRQPQEHKLQELHGLPSALHCTQPAYFDMTSFIIKIPPSGPQ